MLEAAVVVLVLAVVVLVAIVVRGPAGPSET